MDLSTRYLGLDLPHPFVVGAGPVVDTVEGAERAVEAGAAALVMRSLFEEQLGMESMATFRASKLAEASFWEAMTYMPEPDGFVIGPEEYLEHLGRLKARTGVPVIASLNGHTRGGWLRYGRTLEEAGADALELNFYHVATKADEDAARLEDGLVEMVSELRDCLSIPLAVKFSPFYTSFANVVRRCREAGADGFVLFNRYYEPDIDVENLELESRLVLSTSEELGLRLRWLAIVSANLDVDLAVSGGVHTALDAVKAIMCGARVVQMVSALLKHGPEHLTRVRDEVARWMEEREYHSIAQMCGSMDLDRCPDPTALARANYIRRLQTWQ